ncbi:MAG: rhodanese-like domain-containing protein [Bacteroidetes bacterium]|nr:rhodanese-like domain-containing protein [Bacteroidota bacterium]
MLKENYQDLPAGKPLIFVDASGIHSREAVKFLMDKGLNGMVANLAGGLVEWERDEMLRVIDRSGQLSGPCMCQLRPVKKKK